MAFKSLFVALFGIQLSIVAGQFGGMMGGMGGGMYGSCTFDPKCYMYSPCSLQKSFPFWRQTPVTSCEECLALCQSKMNGTGMFCCRSVVYDAVARSCDLFAVQQNPGNKVKYEGRVYFQPTGAPGCAAPATNATTPAAASACKEGETAKLIETKDYAVDGTTGKDAPGLDADGCGKACMAGKLPDGTDAPCKSALFKDGKCTLSTSEPKDSDVKKSDGATFFRLLCFPNDLVKGCPDKFYAFPQKILVGQNKQTLDKGSLAECVKSCLNSQKENGFVCKSAIYYYDEKTLNCILNIESSKTKPDLFTDAGPEDVEVYFETGCGGGQRFHDVPKKRSKAFKDALNDIPEAGPWALWAPCKGRKSAQVRFQRCRELDSRDCPKEQRSCDPSIPSNKGVTKLPGKKGVDEKLINDQQMKARDQASHRARDQQMRAPAHQAAHPLPRTNHN